MNPKALLIIGVVLFAIALSACGSGGRSSLTPPSGQAPPSAPVGRQNPFQSPAIPQAPATSQPPLTANVPIETIPTEPEISAPSEPTGAAVSTLNPSEGAIITLVPTKPFTDADLITAMTLLKIEFSSRPELRVKDILRHGSGDESVLLVQTALSTPKPVIAVINAFANRERFDGRVGSKTIFTNNDLIFVCKLAACAAVEDMSVCPSTSGGVTCSYGFGMVINEAAAGRLTESLKGLPTKSDNGDTVIAEPVNLYLNNNLIDYVYIPADMADKAVTDFTISGNATGTDAKDAQKKAVAAMDRIRDQIARKILPVDFKISPVE